MAKFQFRLQNILSIKEKFEEQKKMELHSANQTFELEKNKLNILNDLRERNNHVFRNSVENKVKVCDIRKMNETAKFYNSSITEQNNVIVRASNHVKLIRKELQEALIEKKMYEKLKDNALEEYSIEENKEEQKQMDEIVSYKYR